MTANRFSGVRAANCCTVEMARLARQHNDANVLALGERLLDWEIVPDIITAFLETPTSSEERHRRRVRKIDTVTAR
jgi:RpiB/LacA/LacB family sugar-phosphate isomerase